VLASAQQWTLGIVTVYQVEIVRSTCTVVLVLHWFFFHFGILHDIKTSLFSVNLQGPSQDFGLGGVILSTVNKSITEFGGREPVGCRSKAPCLEVM